jgi:phage tail protein X
MRRAVDGDDVGAVVWREYKRLRGEWVGVENALGCDAYRPEMLEAARALEKLANNAARMARKLREAQALSEPVQ